MEFKFIKTEVRGKTGIIILDRPEMLNTLNESMMVELAEAFSDFDKDEKIGAILIRGSDKSFCAGLDVKEFSSRIGEFDSIMETFKSCFIKIRRTQKPVTAAAAGYVLGIGAELLLCADIILASDNFRLALPEISLGMIPGLGVLNSLVKIMGKPKALEMALCERAILGDEAERCGIISRIVPLPDLFNEAYKTAERTANAPGFVAKAIKESVSSAETAYNINRIENAVLRNRIILHSDDFRNYIRNFNKTGK